MNLAYDYVQRRRVKLTVFSSLVLTFISLISYCFACYYGTLTVAQVTCRGPLATR